MKRKILLILAIVMMFILTACESASSDVVSSKGLKKSESSAVTESAKTSTGEASGSVAEDFFYFDDESGYYIVITYNEKGLISRKAWTRDIEMLPDYIEWYKYDDNRVLISSDLITNYYPDSFEGEGTVAIEQLVSRTYYKDYLVAKSKEEYKPYSKGDYLWKLTEYGENYSSNPNDLKITEYSVDSDSGEVQHRYVTDLLNSSYISEELDSNQNVTFSKQFTIEKDGNMKPVCAYLYSYYGTEYSGYIYYEYDEFDNKILEKEYNGAGVMQSGTAYKYFDDHRTVKYYAYLDESYVGGKTFECELDMQNYDLKNTVYSKDGSISEQQVWEYYEDDHSLKSQIRYLCADSRLYEAGRDEYDEIGRLIFTCSYASEGVLANSSEYVYYPDSNVVQYNCEISSMGGSTEKQYCDEYGRLIRQESFGTGYATILEFTYYDYEIYITTYSCKTYAEYTGTTLDDAVISLYYECDELGRSTLSECYESGEKIGRWVHTYWGDTENVKRSETWNYMGKLYLQSVSEFSEDGNHCTEKGYNPDGSLEYKHYY